MQPSLACGADDTAVDARSWPDSGHQEYEPTMENVSLPIRWQCGLASIRVGEASHPGHEGPTSSPNVLAVAPHPGLPLPCLRFQDGGTTQSLHDRNFARSRHLHGSQPSGWVPAAWDVVEPQLTHNSYATLEQWARSGCLIMFLNGTGEPFFKSSRVAVLDFTDVFAAEEVV